MSKKLVAYFSASGHTRKLSQTLAEAIGADSYEIKPTTPYTGKDLITNLNLYTFILIHLDTSLNIIIIY